MANRHFDRHGVLAVRSPKRGIVTDANVNSASGGGRRSLEYPATSALGSGEWASASKGQKGMGEREYRKGGSLRLVTLRVMGVLLLALSAGIVTATPASAAPPSAPVLKSVRPGPDRRQDDPQVVRAHRRRWLPDHRVRVPSPDRRRSGVQPSHAARQRDRADGRRSVPGAGRWPATVADTRCARSTRRRACTASPSRPNWTAPSTPDARARQSRSERRAGNAGMATLEVDRRSPRQLSVQGRYGNRLRRAHADPRGIDHAGARACRGPSSPRRSLARSSRPRETPAATNSSVPTPRRRARRRASSPRTLSKPGKATGLTMFTSSVSLGTGEASQAISWNLPANNGGMPITNNIVWACSTAPVFEYAVPQQLPRLDAGRRHGGQPAHDDLVVPMPGERPLRLRDLDQEPHRAFVDHREGGSRRAGEPVRDTEHQSPRARSTCTGSTSSTRARASVTT